MHGNEKEEEKENKYHNQMNQGASHITSSQSHPTMQFCSPLIKI
jgi:hypothetical protein